MEQASLAGRDPVPTLLLLRVWSVIGLQSFGGGVATLALIRGAAVDRYGWITGAEFTRYWSLCQMTPGINLLALAVLLGRRCAGGRGILVALVGLLAPSFTVTVLLTAGYARVHESAAVRAILR